MRLMGFRSALRLGAALAVVGGVLATAAFSQSAQVEVEDIRDSWIFVFDHTVSPNAALGLAEIAVRNEGGRLSRVYSSAIRGFSARMPAAVAARLAARNPSIVHYEPDRIMRIVMTQPPSDPPQETPWSITRVNGGVGAAGKTAWVIDTGVDLDHRDLNVDTGRSVTFARGRSADDGHGHGTHVAGTIAALNNDIGVIGVAAGASVVAVRVLGNTGSGRTSDVIAGVDYVAKNGKPGDVANMSLGGPGSLALDQAVKNAAAKGVRFSIAAGNDARDAANTSPARAEGPNIWTVSAIDAADNFAVFSNFGPHIECAEPGVNVYSTYRNNGYATLSGTSMAAPHLAGVLLLGGPRTDGFAKNDPDGAPDPICVY